MAFTGSQDPQDDWTQGRSDGRHPSWRDPEVGGRGDDSLTSKPSEVGKLWLFGVMVLVVYERCLLTFQSEE